MNALPGSAVCAVAMTGLCINANAQTLSTEVTLNLSGQVSHAVGTTTAQTTGNPPSLVGTTRADASFGVLTASGSGSAQNNVLGMSATDSASFSDRVTITIPGAPAGQAGTFTAAFSLAMADVINSACSTFCGFGGVTGSNNWTVTVTGGPTFSDGTSGAARTDSSTTVYSFQRGFVSGLPFGLDLALNVNAGFLLPVPGLRGGISYFDQFRWLGITDVTTPNGLHPGFQLASRSGTDWRVAAAIPEPGTFVLLSAGLLALGSIAIKRRPASVLAS